MNNCKNYAFIDGQNLYMGTNSEDPPWVIDLFKFRKYLYKKYKVKKAYYYIGQIITKNSGVYNKIKEAGFIIINKEHINLMLSNKKGNVDSDIIFDIMKKICEKEDFGKVLLVSGDGDYIKLVKYLIEKNKFEKILFPNRKFYSSLYKQITIKYFDYLHKIKHLIRLDNKK
jgi:uncharacterized LabA/DUF88 family protein